MRGQSKLFLAILAMLCGAAEPSLASTRSPKPCNAATAERADVRAIATRPALYRSHCVQVTGTINGLTIYADIDGVYQQPKDIQDPSSNGARLGLDNSTAFRPRNGYFTASIIGRVQDCEEARNDVDASAPKGTIAMIAGYCHSWDGAYLWIEHLRILGRSDFTRKQESRPGYGDLQEAPKDWPHRVRVAGYAKRFLSLLRAGNQDDLLDLHRGISLDVSERAKLQAFLFHSRKSPFKDIRTGTDDPQMTILIEPGSNDPSAKYYDPNDYSSYICFCRQGDCSGRWPIATWDADNLPGRPYVCTRVGDFVDLGRILSPSFETQTGGDGLREPE